MDRMALFGEADGGGEQRIEPLAAETGGEFLPGGDGAGDGNRMRGVVFEPIEAAGGEIFGARIGGGAARAVEGEDPALRRRPVEAETVPPDPGRLRLDHPEHRAGSDRRVHGVAARPQDVERGEGGGGHRGCRHGGGGIDRAASGQLEIAHHGSPLAMLIWAVLPPWAMLPWRGRGFGR